MPPASGFAAPRQEAARWIVGEDGTKDEQSSASAQDDQRYPVYLRIERKADQFDRVRERVELDRHNRGTGCFHEPARADKAPMRQRTSEKITKFITPAKFSSCLTTDDISIPSPPSMRPESTSAVQHEKVPDGRRADVPKSRDKKESINLQNRNGGPGDQFRAQKVPARERADEQGAHIAHLAVIDHRERRLHAIKKLNHRNQAGSNVLGVKNVGLVRGIIDTPSTWRKPAAKMRQPNERTYQRRNKALSLMYEPEASRQTMPFQANSVLAQRKAAVRMADGNGAMSLSDCRVHPAPPIKSSLRVN